MGTFFVSPNKTSPTNDEVQRLVGDKYQNGFSSQIFASNLEVGKPTYGYGEKMKSYVDIDGSTYIQQFQSGLPFPKADSFGICNNFKSAHFFRDDESSCTQMADLQTECANILSADYYTSKVKVYLGRGGSRSDAL